MKNSNSIIIPALTRSASLIRRGAEAVKNVKNLKLYNMKKLNFDNNPLGEFLNNCVNFQDAGYDDSRENNIVEGARQLHKEAIGNWNKRGTLAERFTEALQGLPTYINAPFYNCEIFDLMYALGYCEKEDEQSEIVDLYWRACGQELEDAFFNYSKLTH